MSITGEEGRPPVRMGLAMGDLAGSLFSATAIVSALLNREKTGNGTMLDISLLDCQVSLLTYLSEYFLVGGLVPGPQGSGHETLIPYRAFKAKDYYLTLACFNEKHWGALCEAICEGTGCDDIKTNPKFCNAMTRNLNKDEVNQELERVLLTKTVEEWGTIFDKNNIPWGPVNTIDRALSDPQVLARNMVVDIKHPVEGTYKTVGNPIKIHDMVEEFNPVPLVGQQTREFLTDILKYHNDIVDQLFKEGIVGEQTPADLEEIQKIFKPLMNIK
jgi:CoA:oxalate CoA-transferase